MTILLNPRDIIVISDETIDPPGPKMVVCVEPVSCFFYRINTKPWRPAAKLVKDPDHPFLDHDSYLECGDPLEIDEFIIEQSIKIHGIVGQIHTSVCSDIIKYLAVASTLRLADKEAIIAALS